jgi:hypothetical protein
MAKFLTGNELNAELERLFEKAEEQLILISPYIKLHDRFASTLKTKLKNHKLEIILVFGKNEEDMSRSMKQEDFNFFKEFPNIQIRYEKRLHAKYYANENSAILTSMNLYSYSQDNNIEAGVSTKLSMIGHLASNLIADVTRVDSFDSQAYEYFKRVIDQSELLYHKKPQYENAHFGLTKKYIESTTEIDILTDFFNHKLETSSNKVQYGRNNIDTKEKVRVIKEESGFCIRTGKPIQFNTEKPYSDEAFKSWNQFKNEDYPEKFCHFSGEFSEGETTMAKPILRKNWKKAKEVHGF